MDKNEIARDPWGYIAQLEAEGDKLLAQLKDAEEVIRAAGEVMGFDNTLYEKPTNYLGNWRRCLAKLYDTHDAYRSKYGDGE